MKNREIICMLLASGGQNNYKISNQTQTTGKMTKERWERSTEDITFHSLISKEAEEKGPVFTYSVQSNNKGVPNVEVTADSQ